MNISPSLEYLHGYAVKRLLIPKTGLQWAIEFSNGAIVTNQDDELLDMPTEAVEGLTLVTTMYGEEDTRLRFGNVDEQGNVTNQQIVVFTPGRYTIIDPRFGGDPYTPQQVVVDDVTDLKTIRDEFNERAAEAPEPSEGGEAPSDAAQGASEAENGSDSLEKIDLPTRPRAELS